MCLVMDECHRATGRHDSVLALRQMKTFKCKFRVLGLSATPGSSREAIQVLSLPNDLLSHLTNPPPTHHLSLQTHHLSMPRNAESLHPKTLPENCSAYSRVKQASPHLSLALPIHVLVTGEASTPAPHSPLPVHTDITFAAATRHLSLTLPVHRLASMLAYTCGCTHRHGRPAHTCVHGDGQRPCEVKNLLSISVKPYESTPIN